MQPMDHSTLVLGVDEAPHLQITHLAVVLILTSPKQIVAGDVVLMRTQVVVHIKTLPLLRVQFASYTIALVTKPLTAIIGSMKLFPMSHLISPMLTTLLHLTTPVFHGIRTLERLTT